MLFRKKIFISKRAKKKYITYCDEFEKMNNILSQELLKIMKNPNINDIESSQL